MTGEHATKLCPFCCEPMDERARRCPHCRMPQTRWACAFHPAIVGVFYIVVSLGIIGFFMWSIPWRRGAAELARCDGQLTILESRLRFGERGDEPELVVLGAFRNDSEIPWENVQFEVRFLDEERKLIDTYHSVYYGPIRSGLTGTFRVHGRPYLPDDRYGDYEVVITGATDARGWP